MPDRRHHTISIVSNFLDDRWAAECSCGWKGIKQDSSEAATADGASHIALMYTIDLVAESKRRP
jgi:hypothetical protein